MSQEAFPLRSWILGAPLLMKPTVLQTGHARGQTCTAVVSLGSFGTHSAHAELERSFGSSSSRTGRVRTYDQRIISPPISAEATCA
jgi:hypothetical protein